MRSKPFVTYCVMFVLLSSFASATLDFTSVWSFQGSPVNGVRALNYECTNGLCDPLGTKISDRRVQLTVLLFRIRFRVL